jgi:ATP-dependent Lon protease
VEFPSLVEDEKLEIAKMSLIPKQFQKVGLSPEEIKITDKALLKIIRNYTLEAGVRKLQGEIERISHKIARMKASGGKTSWEITENNLEQFLGTPIYIPDTAETKPEVGVVMGLAWTMAGGDIMLIEALKMPGSGQITSTGSLGEIIKESVVAALSYVRSRADLLGIKYQDFLQHDIHIHLPSGAVPKDGPSAGLAIALAIASVLSDKPVRNDLAVSGEISLRGRVLPVSGIREKVSAANRVGIKNVILPKENQKDLEELPQSLRKQMNFIFVENVDEVFRIAILNYQEKKINLDFLASEIKKIVKREDKRKMKKVSQAKKGVKQAKTKKRGRRR